MFRVDSSEENMLMEHLQHNDVDWNVVYETLQYLFNTSGSNSEIIPLHDAREGEYSTACLHSNYEQEKPQDYSDFICDQGEKIYNNNKNYEDCDQSYDDDDDDDDDGGKIEEIECERKSKSSHKQQEQEEQEYKNDKTESGKASSSNFFEKEIASRKENYENERKNKKDVLHEELETFKSNNLSQKSISSSLSSNNLKIESESRTKCERVVTVNVQIEELQKQIEEEQAALCISQNPEYKNESDSYVRELIKVNHINEIMLENALSYKELISICKSNIEISNKENHDNVMINSDSYNANHSNERENIINRKHQLRPKWLQARCPINNKNLHHKKRAIGLKKINSHYIDEERNMHQCKAFKHVCHTDNLVHSLWKQSNNVTPEAWMRSICNNELSVGMSASKAKQKFEERRRQTTARASPELHGFVAITKPCFSKRNRAGLVMSALPSTLPVRERTDRVSVALHYRKSWERYKCDKQAKHNTIDENLERSELVAGLMRKKERKFTNLWQRDDKKHK